MFNNIKRPMEIGLSSFAETPPDVHTGKSISHAERLRNILEEVELGDQVGLDVYGVGEHHREDNAASRPATVLAAAATQTKSSELTRGVSVRSSEEMVSVYQKYAAIDALSNGRAEIMVGSGSYIESFPLYVYNWNDYTELFQVNLDL